MLQIGPNTHLRFTGAKVHTIPTRSKKGTALCLDLSFEDFTHRFFDPDTNDKNIWLETWKYLAHFLEVCRVDATQIPKVFSWHDMANRFAKLANDQCHNELLFVKITLNKDQFKRLGELPCFAKEPVLMYSEQDSLYYQPMTDDDIEITEHPDYE